MEVTEGEHYGGEASVTPGLMDEKRANWGKHRTEVTEVTEGEHYGGGFGDAVADKRETRELGKASHRGHGGHRGGALWRRLR